MNNINDLRAVEQVVTSIITSERSILPHDYLPDLGLDSVGTVQLFIALEDTLGLRFPDEALSIENFQSISNILRLVSEVRLAGTGTT